MSGRFREDTCPGYCDKCRPQVSNEQAAEIKSTLMAITDELEYAECMQSRDVNAVTVAVRRIMAVLGVPRE